MAGRFRWRQGRLVARMDAGERGVVVSLLEQTQQLLLHAPANPPDEFEALMNQAGLADLDRDPGAPEPPQGGMTPRAPQGSPERGGLAGPGGSPAREGQPTQEGPPGPDPALARLLPTGHLADRAVAAEFRALTQAGLIERKAARLAEAAAVFAAASGDRIAMTPEQADAVAIALTDVRLVLGERLGLETDDDANAIHLHQAEALEDESRWADPRFAFALTYDFLTWMQESIVDALLQAQPDPPGDQLG